MENKREESGRLAYEKPVLRKIELATDEVMAVGCKLAGGAGGPLPPTCSASSCSEPGS